MHTLCDSLDEVCLKPQGSYQDQINYVDDLPGYDMRYAIAASKIQRELRWTPNETIETGMRKTISWYLNNEEWFEHEQDGSYQRKRLGVVTL